jgi:formate dehydrogenase maturation protein FdhE
MSTSPVNFDIFIKKNWPRDVPEDCTNMKQTGASDNDGLDCLERNAPAFETCGSCRTYAYLSMRFSQLGRTR